MTDPAADTRVRSDALLVIAHVIRGAGLCCPVDGRDSLRNHVAGLHNQISLVEALPDLLDLLSDPEVGQSEDIHMRGACVEAMGQLLGACPRGALAGTAPRLTLVALLLLASERLVGEGEAEGSGPAGPGAAAGKCGVEKCDVAAEQAAAAEKLLSQLAGRVVEGSGCGAVEGVGDAVDHLLASHRGPVLQLVSWGCFVGSFAVTGYDWRCWKRLPSVKGFRCASEHPSHVKVLLLPSPACCHLDKVFHPLEVLPTPYNFSSPLPPLLPPHQPGARALAASGLAHVTAFCEARGSLLPRHAAQRSGACALLP